MRLTPTDRDRLLIFTAAELARVRKARGLQLNVPEATALIADTVCEAARDGLRLMEAAARGASVLTATDVLPGVVDIVREVKVEAVFDDGTTQHFLVTHSVNDTAATAVRWYEFRAPDTSPTASAPRSRSWSRA